MRSVGALMPEEAAAALREFHPKVVYPYQYSGSYGNVFTKALVGAAIDVRLRNWH